MSDTARIRLLVGGVFAVLLVLAGALLSIPLLVGDPLPVVRPGSTPALLSEGGPRGGSAQIQVGLRGEFVLDLAFAPDRVEPPHVEVRMPEHGMGAPPPEVRTLGGGRFHAVGQLMMHGRWEITVEQEEAVQIFEFILAEF